MLAMWRAEGIGCDLVARLPGRLPGLYTIRTDRRGERTFTYWRSASAARDVLRGAHGSRIAERLAGHDLLYLSGITLSILDPAQRETLMALADAVRAQGGRVAFDSNFRPAGWPDRDEARATFDRMLRRVDIALPTLDDDQALFGVRGCRGLRRAACTASASPRSRSSSAARLLPVLRRARRRGACRAGRAGGRQHGRRRQLQCRLSRRAPRRRRA